MKITLIIIVSIYLIYSIRIQIKLIKSKVLDKNQKILNSVFLWIIPFLWGLLIKTMLKDTFKSKPKGKYSDNWWFLTGIGGDNSSHHSDSFHSGNGFD